MKRPEDDFENVYDLLEHAIDYAFEGKMTLKFYDLLKYRKTTKVEVEAFLHSSTAKELADEVLELKEYIKGGRDSEHQQLREAYHHTDQSLLPSSHTETMTKYYV